LPTSPGIQRRRQRFENELNDCHLPGLMII
jgi:hypothetical protein